MGIVSLLRSVIGGSDSIEEPKIVSNFNTLQTLLNGNLDFNNFAARAGILPAQLAAAILDSAAINDGTTVRRGKCIVPGAETHTSGASYGLLPTPDRVQRVTVPADALVYVHYEAIWRASASAGPGRAAIFIGSNQLKAHRVGSGVGPYLQAGSMDPSGQGGNYTKLTSCANGLVGFDDTLTSMSDDVTTGQTVGVAGASSSTAAEEFNGSTVTQPNENHFGGPCIIDNLAAGTYDFSVQFRATTGTVTVRSRRLRVWVLGF